MLPTPPEAWLDLGGVSVVGGLVPRGVVEAWEFAEWVVVVKEGIYPRVSFIVLQDHPEVKSVPISVGRVRESARRF